jgi:sialic acid synthase SpsE
VAIRDIGAGEAFTRENIWVKRPGTGEIKADHYESLLARRAAVAVAKDAQVRWNWVD